MRFYVISDNGETLTGMRLAGIEGELVCEKREVREAVSRCINDPSIGVILIAERLAALCPELIGEMKLKDTKTLVVEIPDRHGTLRGPDSITHYIREAIGIKI